jgi:hypothetical protein
LDDGQLESSSYFANSINKFEGIIAVAWDAPPPPSLLQ